MKKENFKNLLIDLYTIYNKANLTYVDDLVEKFGRMEADAVKNIFLKYNRKGNAYYDVEKETDEFVIKLVRDYENGNRNMQNVDLTPVEVPQEKTSEQKESEITEKIQQNVSQTIDEKTKVVEEFIKNKERELAELYNKKMADLQTIPQNKIDDDVEIRIFSKYTNTELELPNKRIIAGLGRGSRLVVRDGDGKIIGLEIQEITYDGVEGKPIVEIIVDKV